MFEYRARIKVLFKLLYGYYVKFKIYNQLTSINKRYFFNVHKGETNVDTAAANSYYLAKNETIEIKRSLACIKLEYWIRCTSWRNNYHCRP
jgi:hypothetical protein